MNFDTKSILNDAVYDALTEVYETIEKVLRYKDDMPTTKDWREAFEYFMISLKRKKQINRVHESNKPLNELKASSYLNASKKARDLKQINRSTQLLQHSERTFRKNNETNDIFFTVDGFFIDIPKGVNNYVRAEYVLSDDKFYVKYEDDNEWSEVEPGDYVLRTEDRKIIKTIINYFKEFNPESIYNDKNLFIA